MLRDITNIYLNAKYDAKISKKLVVIGLREQFPFCDPNMLFLWHSKVAIDKISLFPNFHLILGFVCELCTFKFIILFT